MQKINIIQFLPYFPPHKWWLETVAEEFSSIYVSKWYWKVFNIIFDVWQNFSDENINYIKNKKWENIAYEQNWYTVYFVPSFDIIPNFPVPKIWRNEFWNALKSIKIICKSTKNWNEKFIIQTHTRFFISSFIWWIFAKYNNLKWIHIEHWSDYVKLWSEFKSKIAFFYDRIIWKWIFKNSDKVLAISNWVANFIKNEFKNINFIVIYNGIIFNSWKKIENTDIIKIWFVWRLVSLKWVLLLIEVFQNLSNKYLNIELEIVWNWDEKQNLEKYILENNLKNIKFLWFKNREYIANDFLPQIDILINPSYQEWLPTTVLEWLISWCVVVATDVWWTKEITDQKDLIIVEKWNLIELEKWLEKAIINYKSIRWLSKHSVKEKFNWDKIIELYFNLYKNL